MEILGIQSWNPRSVLESKHTQTSHVPQTRFQSPTTVSLVRGLPWKVRNNLSHFRWLYSNWMADQPYLLPNQRNVYHPACDRSASQSHLAAKIVCWNYQGPKGQHDLSWAPHKYRTCKNTETCKKLQEMYSISMAFEIIPSSEYCWNHPLSPQDKPWMHFQRSQLLPETHCA